jgi:3-oxoacyl-[acyl-carrier protein] reductase
MSDFLLELGQNPNARKLVKTLGLPIPLPEKLQRAKGPVGERPLEGIKALYASSAKGVLAPKIAETLAASGATLHVVGDDALAAKFKDAGEAYGRPATVLAPGAESDLRPNALVFDATGFEDVADISALYTFFHPWASKVARSGRVVVLGRAPQGLAPAKAAAQTALEGFVRSVAKEIGRNGSTANLVYVEAGADDRAAAVLEFLLSPRSAFVDAQPLRVSATVKGAAARASVRSLEGKVALVTGAARGIGAATARLLAGEGARVVCLDRPADDGPTSQLARDIRGGAILLDVSDPEAPQKLAAELEDRFGGVDIVVHNAGITRDKTLARMSTEHWDQVAHINLTAVVRMTEALLAGPMKDNGRIIALSSIAGLAGNVGQTNYAASKAGVAGYVRALAPTLAGRGITVNAIAPGFIETRMTAAIPIAIREVARRMSALGQGGQPQDVGEAITFLASPAAIGLTGQVLRVCGGSLVGA